MTTGDAHSIREDIRELREAVATVERLQREAFGRANGRLTTEDAQDPRGHTELREAVATVCVRPTGVWARPRAG
jgi:hypothetical protein